MVEVSYATREDVKSALDVAETARTNAQIDREIQAASRSIEGDVLRYFYPSVSTQTFDWPDHQFTVPWRLWLNDRELTSVTQVLAAGTDITASVMLRPDDAPLRSAPFTHLEIDLSTSAAFNAGATFQRAISVTGVFGYCAGETPGGTMVSAFTDTVGTAGTISDSSLIGVGSIIRVDSERMIVTGKNMVATGQTLAAPLGAVNNNNLAQVQASSAIQPGEIILMDAERMRVDDQSGSTQLVVTRPWDGSALAAHNIGAVVSATRLLTVQRGALGTTATTHTANAPIFVHAVPSLIRDWCVAEALSTLSQVRRGYTQPFRRANSGDPKDAREIATSLEDLRSRARARFARLRTRTAERLI